MDELNEDESAFARLLSQIPCDDQGRAEHRDALRLRALDAFDAAGRQKIAPAAWKRVFNHGREIMRRPLPRLLAAASVCLAIVAVRGLIPVQPSTAQAFNMFAKALADAHSATFQFEERDEGKAKVESKGYYLAPGKMRVETKDVDVHVTDWNAGRVIDLDPKQKIATVMNLKNAPKNGSPQLVFEKLRDLFAESLDANENHFEPLGEKEIDGHRAVGFRSSSPWQSVILWGDPTTGLPVLVDVVQNLPATSKITMSHFVLNDKLDPALFDTTPPADYKVRMFDLDMSKLSEATLVEGLRLAADLNDGQFLDNLDAASTQALFAKGAATDKKAKSDDAPPDWLKLEMLAWTVGRGLTYASQLPKAADAHYAGKGVKRGEPDRPIFWYKPEGAKTYRVIYADLSVKDADQAPDAARLLAADGQSTFQAFNMFAEQLVDAHSATFRMQTSIEGQGKQEGKGFYLAPGKLRSEAEGVVSIVDRKAAKMVILSSKHKTATVLNLKNEPGKTGSPQLTDLIERLRDLLLKTKEAKEDEFERLGEKEIDGHRTIGFRYASPAESTTLWGDPASGLPALVEVVWSGSPRTEITLSHFELNEKLDPALFDTTPPADYKVQTLDVDASTEAALVEGLGVTADWNGGVFIDGVDSASLQALVLKHMEKEFDGKKEKPQEVPPEVMKQIVEVGRGLIFALELPESADAHYAGKGVKRGEPDRPIFWFKPEGAKTYRVIFADLSVKEAEKAPEVAGAVRLEKVKPPAKQEAPQQEPARPEPAKPEPAKPDK